VTPFEFESQSACEPHLGWLLHARLSPELPARGRGWSSTTHSEILIASATGSQLSAYAYSSSNIIWVAGAQKITPSLETAFQRLREYCLPLEDKHMKQLYGDRRAALSARSCSLKTKLPTCTAASTSYWSTKPWGFNILPWPRKSFFLAPFPNTNDAKKGDSGCFALAVPLFLYNSPLLIFE
jgi:hypothetical protein